MGCREGATRLPYVCPSLFAKAGAEHGAGGLSVPGSGPFSIPIALQPSPLPCGRLLCLPPAHSVPPATSALQSLLWPQFPPCPVSPSHPDQGGTRKDGHQPV